MFEGIESLFLSKPNSRNQAPAIVAALTTEALKRGVIVFIVSVQ